VSALMLKITRTLEYPLPELKAQLEFDPIRFVSMQLKLWRRGQIGSEEGSFSCLKARSAGVSERKRLKFGRY